MAFGGHQSIVVFAVMLRKQVTVAETVGLIKTLRFQAILFMLYNKTVTITTTGFAFVFIIFFKHLFQKVKLLLITPTFHQAV